MARYLYSELARLVDAQKRCASAAERLTATGMDLDTRDLRAEWAAKHYKNIAELVREYMPSGSGIDSGTQIDLDSSHLEKLVFTTSFHHMNENGYYDGWTDHTVTVTPSFLGGFNLRISGRNRNDIKEYLDEVFSECLRTDLEPSEVKA